MLNRYYEQELHNLRSLAAEFGRRNPALAPLLGSAAAVDADVERLLEGVAFMTGLVRQRLDDDFPEFVQSLAQLMFPQFLRPVPCMTIMQYSPRSVTGETLQVPVGTTFSSSGERGERAVFNAIYPVAVEPLRLEHAYWDAGQRASQVPALVLELALTGLDAAQWEGDSLRLWLGGSETVASGLFRILMRDTRAIYVGSPQGSMVRLEPACLRPFGFDPAYPLLPWPAGAHPAWRILHEYFALPEKLRFLELKGLERWRARQGTRLVLRFEFDRLPDWAPEVSVDNFVLHASPAVNLYPLDGQPLYVDHRQPEYRIRPVTGRQGAQIYSVDRVDLRSADGLEQGYQPASDCVPGAQSYHIRVRASALSSGCEHYLSLPGAGLAQDGEQVLSLRLSCTDGSGPDDLRLGEICEATDRSPVRVTFSNITGVTSYREPYLAQDLLWRVLSHMQANQMALSSAESLRKLLLLYLPEQRGESGQRAAGLRQIESIQQVQVQSQRRMVRGMPVQGSTVRIECAGDHFSGPGSLYLFGSVLNEFLSGCATMNTFIALTLHDTVHGETLQWPAQIGQQRLL